MADLTITAASVIKGSTAVVTDGLSGATLTQGMPVYLDTTYKIADANGTLTYTVAGITLNAGSSGQPIQIQTRGLITIGATVTQGTQYYLSRAAGLICLYSDLSSGDYVVSLGMAVSATQIDLLIYNSGITKP